MAPQTSNQKRKRGRPRDASRNHGSGTGVDELPSKSGLADEDADGDERPRKRGRPAKNQDIVPPAEPAEPAPNVRKRTGRNSKKDRDAPTTSQTQVSPSGVDDQIDSSASGERRSKRDRRSADDHPWWATASNQGSPQDERVSVKRSKGKAVMKSAASRVNIKVDEAAGRVQRSRSNAASSKASRKAEEPRDTPIRRSRRDRHSADENPWWESSATRDSQVAADTGPQDASPAQPEKRGRSAGQKSTAQSATSKVGAPNANNDKRGGRVKPTTEPRRPSHRPPSQGAQASPEAKDAPPVSSASQRNRQTLDPVDGNSSRKGAEPKLNSHRRPRPGGMGKGDLPSSSSNRHVETLGSDTREKEVEAGRQPENNPPEYRQLAPKTRRIPQSLISSKWVPLDEPAVAAIDSLIADTYRPVLLRLHNRGPRYEHAKKILSVVSSRLNSRLRKGMPFPPPCTKTGTSRGGSLTAAGGHVDELDFERTIDANESLETILNPLLHSVALLKSERDKEEEELEREYENLRKLETNAKAEVRSWRERSKRFHVLAGEPDERGQEAHESKDKLELVKGKTSPTGGLFTETQNDEVSSVSVQIGNHMESLKGNLQQIEGILPEITRSKASLQAVLHRHLDYHQYKEVIIG